MVRCSKYFDLSAVIVLDAVHKKMAHFGMSGVVVHAIVFVVDIAFAYFRHYFLKMYSHFEIHCNLIAVQIETFVLASQSYYWIPWPPAQSVRSHD